MHYASQYCLYDAASVSDTQQWTVPVFFLRLLFLCVVSLAFGCGVVFARPLPVTVVISELRPLCRFAPRPLAPAPTIMLRVAFRTASRPLSAAGVRCASTLAGLVQEATTELPFREVVHDAAGKVKWSNSALRDESTAFANGLGELGLGSGDSIITILPVNAENVLTVFAAAKLGVHVVPATPGNAGQLEALLSQTGAKAVIFDPSSKAIIEALLPEVCDSQFSPHDIDHIRDKRFPALDAVITTEWMLTDNGVLNFRQLLMRNHGTRDHVKKNAKFINGSTPLIGGMTNAAVLAAAGK
jgi:hypothetical protein